VISKAGRKGRQIKPSPDDAELVALIEGLNAAHAEERKRAVDTLASLGPGAEVTVPALVLTLRDRIEAVRRSTINALGRIGPGSSSAIDALLEAFNERDARLAEYPHKLCCSSIPRDGPRLKL
jgi:HEAT repeat protein